MTTEQTPRTGADRDPRPFYDALPAPKGSRFELSGAIGADGRVVDIFNEPGAYDRRILLVSLTSAAKALAEARAEQQAAEGLREALDQRDHYIAGCHCPGQPLCVPHGTDGVHQWKDLCDLPHGHVAGPEAHTNAAARQRAVRAALSPSAAETNPRGTPGLCNHWPGQPRCEVCGYVASPSAAETAK